MAKKILILSGPTHEYFDAVRFIGNASSGLMGKAVAEEAMNRGYAVVFVSGPVAEANMPALGASGSIHRVTSAREMLAKARELFPSTDVAVFAAAVADYAPAEQHAEKMAKTETGMVLQLRPTPDIAKILCATKRANQTTIGFALQTADGEYHAGRKLASKHLDGIVLNTPSSLGASTGTFSFLYAGADGFTDWGHIGKTECARRILDAIESIINR